MEVHILLVEDSPDDAALFWRAISREASEKGISVRLHLSDACDSALVASIEWGPVVISTDMGLPRRKGEPANPFQGIDVVLMAVNAGIPVIIHSDGDTERIKAELTGRGLPDFPKQRIIRKNSNLAPWTKAVLDTLEES